jgi:hypothetical protein
MKLRWMHGLAGLTMISLAGCEPIEPPPEVPVVQNITYNNNSTTNVYAPPPASPPEAYSPAPVPPAAPPIVSHPAEEPRANEPAWMDRSRTKLASTGVPVCDAYLARLEVCTTHILSGLPSRDEATLHRMLESFDLVRRSWQRVAKTEQVRESMVDSCGTSVRLYNDSVRKQCP